MQRTLHRQGFVETLRTLLAAVDFAFCKMQRIQFSAPWRNDKAGC